ncbi:hypothetical protein ELQ90_07485 [Labedella phragmitis]|uniref:Uncharacterized protein n=1 Tax=Labedella phragmitis TaxID=2498849 RepID=A0A3S4AMN3_9MICO|nr:hypothetical protein [Labedella phragmitis]RWZ51914.1 hypothetical protein ELQ90_07485 [Labedella phragmitis]
MSVTISFTTADAVADMRTFLSRAARVDDTAARLVVRGDVLAVYVAAFSPKGLLDRGFTVLGLRTVRVVATGDLDLVVPLRSVLDRLATPEMASGDRLAVVLPAQQMTTVWAGISPPRSGWLPVGSVSSTVLADHARRGAIEVAKAVPTAAGDHIVHSVRQAVWTRSIEGRDDVPAGAAFAADAFGFLADPLEEVPLFVSGPWVRLSPRRGHILARRGVA